MTVKDLIAHIVQLKGQELWSDEGLLWGDPATEIRGLLVTWMADVGALQAAAAQGCNVVLCHEQFYFTSMTSPLKPQELSWPANRARLAAAAAGQLTVLRAHGSLDLICIWDDFVAALGVDNPHPQTGWNKVLPIPKTTVGNLVSQIKTRLKLAQVRVSGALDQAVSVAGFPWGGLGLDSNVGYLASCIDQGADVLIAGECDEYGFTFARDAGVPMIETGHAISEDIGIQSFADRLRREFPALSVHFYPAVNPFALI